MARTQNASRLRDDYLYNLTVQVKDSELRTITDRLATLPLKLPKDNVYYVGKKGSDIEIFTETGGIDAFKYEGSGAIEYENKKIIISTNTGRLIIHQAPQSFDRANFKPLEEHLAPVALMEEFARESDPIRRRELIESIKQQFERTPSVNSKLSSITGSASTGSSYRGESFGSSVKAG